MKKHTKNDNKPTAIAPAPAAPSSPDPQILTLSDLCKRWRVAYKTVHNAIREGRLHVFRVGTRAYRVTLEEVLRFEHEERGAAKGAA